LEVNVEMPIQSAAQRIGKRHSATKEQGLHTLEMTMNGAASNMYSAPAMELGVWGKTVPASATLALAGTFPNALLETLAPNCR
jgi:hypothetical protein